MQQIGLGSAVAIVVGNIVGVMIFLTPGEVARHLPWDAWFLAAWGAGAVLALLGAICLGELGAMLPKAGGDYVYLREAYGETLSFLSGWTSVVITFPGSIAAMAVGLCCYQGAELLGPAVLGSAFEWVLGAFAFRVTWAQALAMTLVLGLTAVNHLGVRLSGALQTAITACPVLLMLAAGVAALFVEAGEPLSPQVIDPSKTPWRGMLPALVPVSFAYAGWNASTYVGSEIREPHKNIPRSLVIGTVLASGVYLVICCVLLKGVPASAMSGVNSVPAVALERLFGPWSGHCLTWVVALAVLGSLNATVLAGARISLAMARDGAAFSSLATRSSRFGTPSAALWVQAGLAASLVLTGRFEQLMAYVSVVILAFSSIAVAAVVSLRIRQPEARRPYRTPGYPVSPVLFVLANLAVIGFMLSTEERRAEALCGLLITLLGLPVLPWVRRRRRRSRAEARSAPRCADAPQDSSLAQRMPLNTTYVSVAQKSSRFGKKSGESGRTRRSASSQSRLLTWCSRPPRNIQ